VIDAIAEIDQAEVVVDSTKTTIRAGLLADCRPGRLRVLHLVRDARAVIASDMRRTDTSPVAAATDWWYRNRVAELLGRRSSVAAYSRLRYEDLCREPAKTIQSVVEWVSSRDAGEEEFRMPPWPLHAIPGNPMLRKPVREVSLDERWRRELSPAALRRAKPIVKRLNSHYGYRW
jgi:hypothetical protein